VPDTVHLSLQVRRNAAKDAKQREIFGFADRRANLNCRPHLVFANQVTGF